MDWILYFIAFIIGGIAMFMTICIVYAAKREEPVNRVHFYVAREKNGILLLYFGKPYRTNSVFYTKKSQSLPFTGAYISNFGLNPDDFKDLKWEDDPVEVFINVEDWVMNKDDYEDYSYLDEDEYMSLGEIEDMMW